MMVVLTCGRTAEWKMSSHLRKFRWYKRTCVHTHGHIYSHIVIMSILCICVQFEQENQRLVSEMNSLVDEVR